MHNSIDRCSSCRVLYTKCIYWKIFIASKSLRCIFQVDSSTHHHRNFHTHIIGNFRRMHYISKALGPDFYLPHTMCKLIKNCPIFQIQDLLHPVMPSRFLLGSFNSEISLFDKSVLILFLLISDTLNFKLLTI